LEKVYVDDIRWQVRYLVVRTGNWLPGRHVLISPAWVERVDWAKQQVDVALSEELVKSAPEYDSDWPISREYELDLYKALRQDFCRINVQRD